MHPDIAIAGLGITEMGKVYGRSAPDFAADAVRLAVADAGLTLEDVDGLLINPGLSGGLDIGIAARLGLYNLPLLSVVNAYGSTASVMVMMASLAIAAGQATTVACVFADATLTPRSRTGAAYGGGGGAGRQFKGIRSLGAAAGLGGAPSTYALAARRHMDKYGTNEDHFAAVAVTQRDWAADNEHAQMRDPITVEDHHHSRWIAEPFRLLDCCLVSNGGVAVVVTSGERARNLQQPPAYIWGWGQGHPGYVMERGCEWGLTTGAVQSGKAAFAMAGIGPDDIDVAEIYDCFTFTVIVSLEDYGFCAKGEGGSFAASGALGRGGSLPTNTGGGELSAYYMWGMTPVSEGVIQTRGQGGGRQVDDHDLVLVSGNGGTLDHHGSLILGTQPRVPDVVDVIRDDDSVEFFDGTARGELVIKQCDTCGQYQRPDAMACSKCHGPALSWTTASGRGTLVSWIVVHGEPSSVVGLVELDEGPWLHARLVDVDTESLAVGDPFMVDFEQAGEEKIPIFRAP